ncbi:MAG: hypothetical protein ACYC2R_08185 [Burkholderiales bacterium]
MKWLNAIKEKFADDKKNEGQTFPSLLEAAESVKRSGKKSIPPNPFGPAPAAHESGSKQD